MQSSCIVEIINQKFLLQKQNSKFLYVRYSLDFQNIEFKHVYLYKLKYCLVNNN
jgi:hypothetical protein